VAVVAGAALAEPQCETIPVSRVFVVHYTKNVARRRDLEQALSRMNITAEWVTKYDKEDLTKNTVDLAYDQVRRVHHTRPALNVSRAPPQFKYVREEPATTRVTHTLKPSHVSLAMKHVEVFRTMVEKNFATALVLEDDVQFNDEKQFSATLAGYMGQLPDSWGLLSIGEGNPAMHFPETKPEANVYMKAWGGAGDMQDVGSHNAFRSSDSYVLTLECAKQLYEGMVPFAFPVDNELNLQINKKGINVFWAEPTLTQQGSLLGKYASGIQDSSNEGSPEEREFTFKSVLEMRPDHAHTAEIRANLGFAYSEQGPGRFPEAIELLQEAVAAAPGDRASLYALGSIFFQTKQYSQASQLLCKASSIAPTCADTAQRAGLASFSAGKHKLAAAHLKRALALDPGLPHSVAAYKKLMAAQPPKPTKKKAKKRVQI
jgi:GR25 family glycosyltransferase involved in LPS biosynthesis